MKNLIAIMGIGAFVSVFLGTALGIVLGGFVMGLKVLIASILVLLFAFLLDDMF